MNNTIQTNRTRIELCKILQARKKFAERLQISSYTGEHLQSEGRI